MTSMRLRSPLVLGMLACWSAIGTAEDWMHWRGPQYNGSSAETGLPDTWSTTDNVRWVADLPGPSAATPIICRDHVFVSSTAPDRKQLVAMCLDRNSGKILWQHDVATPISRPRDSRSTYSAASPVTDGKVVVFFYGSGKMAAFDFEGQPLWNRDIEKEYGQFAFQWTFASTPLLHDGRLYLQVLQRNEPAGPYGAGRQDIDSYLLAMDPATGQTLWQHVRPSEAYMESREAYSSPVPFTHNGRPEILIVGGDCISGHDPATGAELWRWGTWNPERIWALALGAVAGFRRGGRVGMRAQRRTICAVKAGGQGMLDDSGLAWTSAGQREVSADVPTPAFYDGDFFVLNDLRGVLSRVDPATGDVKWKLDLKSREKFEASPLAADGKIYVVDFAGQVVVVEAATGNVLNTIPMAEREDSPVRSTISVAHGNLFVRTNNKLYCIGAK